MSWIMETLLLLHHFVIVDSSKKSQNLKSLYWNIRVSYRPELFCKITSNLSPITYSYFFSQVDFGFHFILHQSDQCSKVYVVRPSTYTVDICCMSFGVERLSVLGKVGFGEYFIHRIVLINNQQSCIINGGFTNPQFNLEKVTHQGDSILAYLFILALEVLFELNKNNADIRGTTIFNCAFLYTALLDGSTFFFNDLLSVKNLIDTFKVFSLFSG